MIGESFTYKDHKFTIMSLTDKAVRARINDSGQNIWIPKCYLKVENGKITKVGSIDFKLKSSEFIHKLELSKISSYTSTISGEIRREKDKLTDEKIIQITKQKGIFEVSWRYRDEWLRHKLHL